MPSLKYLKRYMEEVLVMQDQLLQCNDQYLSERKYILKIFITGYSKVPAQKFDFIPAELYLAYINY
jgi:hypothetical protein